MVEIGQMSAGNVAVEKMDFEQLLGKQDDQGVGQNLQKNQWYHGSFYTKVTLCL